MVVLMLKISVATVLFRWLFRIVVDKPVLMAVAVRWVRIYSRMAMPIIINTKFSCGDTGKFIGKILHKPIIRANFAAPFQ